MSVEAHHPHGPSSLKPKEVCGGHRQIEDEDAVPHEVTQQGDRIHNALEHDDTSGLESDEERGLFNATKSVVTALLEDFFGGTEEEGAYTRYNEIRLTIKCPDGSSTWGTLDVLAISADGTKIYCLDYKFGFGKVDEAETNIQGNTYTAGAFQKFPSADTVKFTFLQPRRDWISTADFTREDDLEGILFRVSMILAKVEASEDLRSETAELFPTYEGCFYCTRKADCPAVGQLSTIAAKKRAEAKELVIPDLPEDADLDKPADLAVALRTARILEDWCKSVKGRATEYAKTHEEDLPGFKKVVVKGKRSITNIAEAADILRDEFNLSGDDIIGVLKSVPIGAIEDLVHSKAARGKKGTEVERLANLLADRNVLSYGAEVVQLRDKK